MGYYSRVRGEITFSPPMTHKEAVAYKTLPKPQDLYEAVVIPVYEIRTPSDEGTLVSSTADRIVPASEDTTKCYSTSHDFAYLLTFLPDRTFYGFIEIEGEEQGDLSRWTIEDGKPVEKKAKVVWDD